MKTKDNRTQSARKNPVRVPAPASAEGMIKLLGERFAWDYGEFWEAQGAPGGKHSVLRRASSWRREGVNCANLEAASDGLSGPIETGLAGRVWREGDCEWVEDLTADDAGFMRTSFALSDGFKSVLAVPFSAGDERLGVLLFLSVAPRKADSAVSSEMMRLAQQVSGVVSESWTGALDISQGDRYFRALTERIHDIIIVMAADGEILYESAAVEHVLGYSAEDWVGRNVLGSVHPSDAPLVLESIQAAMATPGSVQRLQLRVQHKDGTWRWLESVGSATMGPTGLVGICSARDITETRLAQEALLERESRLELLNSIARALLDEGTTEEIIGRVLTETAPRFPDLRVTYSTIDDASLMSFVYSQEYPDMPTISGMSIDLTRVPDLVVALRNRSTVRLADVQTDPRLAPISDIVSATGSAATLLAPLRHSDRLMGVLSFSSAVPREWSEHEETTMVEIASYLSIALREASQRELRNIAEGKLREMSDQLRAILDAFPEIGGGRPSRRNAGGQTSAPSSEARRGQKLRLTEQNLKVLRLLAEGMTNSQIAKAMYLSTDTVKDHTRAIFAKLNAKNRAEAVMLATKRGLI